MSWEELAALSTFGTLIVIAGSAIAALVQLRHMRSSNAISATLGLMERWATPEYRTMLNYVFFGQLDERLKDPDFRKGLTHVPVDRLEHPEVAMLDFWETIGSMVKLGNVTEQAFMDTAGFQCVSVWQKLAPVIAIIRRARGPAVYDNFEYLASRSMLWEAKHPLTVFPKGTPHLPTVDAYPEDTAPHVP